MCRLQGKPTLAAVRRWVAKHKPQEFFASWGADSTWWKDDSVAIHYTEPASASKEIRVSRRFEVMLAAAFGGGDYPFQNQPTERTQMQIHRSLIQTFRTIVRAAFHITARRSTRPSIQFVPQPEGAVLHATSNDVSVTMAAGGGGDFSGPLAIDYDDLKPWQGRRGSISFVPSDGGADVHWQNGAIPATKSIGIGEPVAERLWFEDLPKTEPFLLRALAEARQVTDQESLRYALGCIQLDGERGTVTGTDGRQLLMFDGFQFPWKEGVLVRANTALSLAAFADASEVRCGTTSDHLFLQSSSCQLKLKIQREARFPWVEQLLPQAVEAVNVVHLHPLDAQFLRSNVARLPGGEREYAPVSVDLNGHVAVVGWDPETTRSVAVMLSRSTHTGPDLRWSANREYLKRAANLGAYRMYGFGNNRPVLCRGKRTHYIWMPLAGEGPVSPEATVQRIATMPTAA